MTQEERQLLFKDLCARLPYGVKILQGDVVMETLQSICKVGDNDYTVNPITNDMYNGFYIEQVKPYLRPMSSMTEEEKKEHDFYCGYKPYDENIEESYLTEYDMPDYVDWLNEQHFDYRGLIERGLALEAPKDMYKTE